MKLNNTILILAAVVTLGGCVVEPAHTYRERDYYDDRAYAYSDRDYDSAYDYYDTPSYEGYYYTRIVFIGTIPYYVHDDRIMRPVPARLRPHFLQYREQKRYGRVGPFSDERDVRDGYPVSRVIYFNNVPYYVDNDRVARQLPNQLHERFRYAPPPRRDNRRDAPMMAPRDQDRDRPAFMRDQRQEQPYYGREPERREQPYYGREPERREPPPVMQRDVERDRPAFLRDQRQEQTYPEREPPQGRDYDRHEREVAPPVMMREEQQAPPVQERAPERPRFLRGPQQQQPESAPRNAPPQQERKKRPREQQEERHDNGGEQRGGRPWQNGR